MKQFLTVVLIYISLMINNVKHLFMYLLAINRSSSEKCLYTCSLFNWIFCLFVLLLSCISLLHTLDISFLPYICFANFFCHSFVDGFFFYEKSFYYVVPFIYFFYLLPFNVRFKKSLPRPISRNNTAYIFSEEFYCFRSYVQVLIHFEFILYMM